MPRKIGTAVRRVINHKGYDLENHQFPLLKHGFARHLKTNRASSVVRKALKIRLRTDIGRISILPELALKIRELRQRLELKSLTLGATYIALNIALDSFYKGLRRHAKKGPISDRGLENFMIAELLDLKHVVEVSDSVRPRIDGMLKYLLKREYQAWKQVQEEPGTPPFKEWSTIQRMRTRESLGEIQIIKLYSLKRLRAPGSDTKIPHFTEKQKKVREAQERWQNQQNPKFQQVSHFASTGSTLGLMGRVLQDINFSNPAGQQAQMKVQMLESVKGRGARGRKRRRRRQTLS